jgi:photosystem II stability/assembly factor-like uncharacterized protein
MVKRMGVAGLAAFAAVAGLPLLAQSPGDRSCWLRDVAAPGGSMVYALCEQGAYWTTTDNGATWVKGDTKATEKLRGIAFVDAKRGFVIGDRGLMLATEDGGKTWQPRKLDVAPHLMDINFAGEDGWIVGYQGLILHSKDGGRTWERQKGNTNQTLETVHFLDKQHGWVVGWAGTILRTTNGGEKWDLVKCDAAQWSLTSIYFKDPQNGWVVGFNGQVLHSKDGGATWQVQKSPVKSWLTNIAADKNGRMWITYDDGFLVSEDSGETWKALPAGGWFFLSRLQQVNDRLWAVGQSTVLKQDGLQWTRISTLVTSGASGTTTTPAGRGRG